MIKNRVFYDSIFIKLVASMWGHRICVVCSTSLGMVTYRYKLSEKVIYELENADFVLVYNGNITCHYSGVIKCHKNLAYDSVESSDTHYTGGYRKGEDIDEHLNGEDRY